MKKLLTSSVAVLAIAASIGLVGCSSYPSETAKVIDNRPSISFKTSVKPETLTVAVDGAMQGSVDQFIEGKAALRVLPGTHTVTITRADGSQSSQRVYVSDGVHKTLIVQ